MEIRNLFDSPEYDGDEECMETLLERPGVRLERILSHGHQSPDDFWYDQDEDEWVLLVKGGAELEIMERGAVKTVRLKAGDHLLIPAHCEHRVAWTAEDQDTWWLTCFLAP